MEGSCIAAIILLTLVSCAMGSSQYVTFIGNSALSDFGQCFRGTGSYYDDEIRSLELQCSQGAVLHITQLSFSANQACSGASSCTWNPTKERGDCDGKADSCSIESYYSSTCSKVNSVNVTFQCIPEYEVNTMCSSLSTSTTYQLPVYFTTKYFTDSYGEYSSGTTCQCSVEPTGSTTETYIDMLYYDIETGQDSLTIGSTVYDGKQEFQPGVAPNHPNRLQMSGTFWWTFRTDSSVQKRGAWFKLSQNSGSGGVHVSCYDSIVHSAYSGKIKRILGVTLGVGLPLIVIIVVWLIYFTRQSATNPRGPVLRPAAPGPAAVPPYTATPHSTSA